jgi:hypothetical protein
MGKRRPHAQRLLAVHLVEDFAARRALDDVAINVFNAFKGCLGAGTLSASFDG